jgi:hypothetical protein
MVLSFLVTVMPTLLLCCSQFRPLISVPDSKNRNIPEVVIVRRWADGVLGIWKGWDSWVKGGANRVSLQAT